MSAPASGQSDLGDVFRRLIRRTGPISIARYMGESNAHYYASRDPLGAGGDFVTAPEISQMFGEMLGLWCVDLWQRADHPANVVYVELGPGRGTLAKDALRVMNRQGLVPQVHFVEGSGALSRMQREAVPDAHWHDSLADVPADAPMLLVANEFFDALPVHQLVRTEQGWRERMVSLGGGAKADQFVFVTGDQKLDEGVPPDRRNAPLGSILELCPAAAAITQDIAGRLREHGGAALIIDYGYFEPRTGSSLQAVRAQEKVDPLREVGTADLSAHVDFAAIADAARTNGVERLYQTTQGAFLERLGITARANALAISYPNRAVDIATGHRRLCAPDEMGELFKALTIVGKDWPDPAGFA